MENEAVNLGPVLVEGVGMLATVLMGVAAVIGGAVYAAVRTWVGHEAAVTAKAIVQDALERSIDYAEVRTKKAVEDIDVDFDDDFTETMVGYVVDLLGDRVLKEAHVKVEDLTKMAVQRIGARKSGFNDL